MSSTTETSRRPDTVIRNDVNSMLGKMFNNPRYSNIKFLVNDDAFYAERCLLSVSSVYWDSFMFPHSQPRDPSARSREMTEIRLSGIKHSESFLVTLKDVYGMSINFSSLSDEVLEESVRLANNYVLDTLHKSLLAYTFKYRPHLKNILVNYDESYINQLLGEDLAYLNLSDDAEVVR